MLIDAMARYQQLHPPFPFETYAHYLFFLSPNEGVSVIHLWFGLVRSSFCIFCISRDFYEYIEIALLQTKVGFTLAFP